MLRSRLISGLVAFAALTGAGATRASAQGVTTGGIAGTVTDESGRPVADAQVQLRNPSTGFNSGTLTRASGQYQILGLQPDANYILTVRRIGFEPMVRQPVRVILGETSREDVKLSQQAARLEAVTVVGTTDPVINATKTGTGTTWSDSALARLPTLNRNFTDFVASVPQVSTTTGYLSGGGVNVRQNSIQIDGAQAGDLFGLGTTGQPGAQANAKSIPLDAVKEYQVLLSPFDIRQGNFGGLLLNAVTKSGTNTLHGSAYFYTRDQKLTRSQEYLFDYTQQQYGFNIGGPILKDRLFFFVNPEWQRLKTPATGPYLGSTNPRAPIDQSAINQFSTIAAQYGLTEPGSGAQVQKENPLTNVFARVDAYLPWNTRLVLRHNYAAADNMSFSRSNPATTSTPNFNLTSNLYEFSSRTHSSVAELLTSLPNGLFNEFLVNYTTIKDFRTVPVWFPMLTVQGIQRADTNLANARIVAGTENSSQGNTLDQRTFELTNNLTIPVGSHSFTVGAKGIFYKPVNLFAQNRLGNWTFTNLTNFQNGVASNYQVSAPAPTDPAGGLATFRANNYSAYLQDQWTATPRLTVTAGVRFEKPHFVDTPPENASVFTEYGRHTSSVPTRAQVSPRLGFNWDVTGDKVNQLRGGVGYFTGSVPFVYLSNAFGNSGLSGFASLTCNGTTSGTFSQIVPQFNASTIATPPTRCADQVSATGQVIKQGATVAASANINTIDPDFKFPTYQKATLAYDRRLFGDLVATIEGLVTRSVNNVFYQNLALAGTQGTDARGRVMYGNLTATGSAPVYKGSRTQVLDATNSSGDYIGSITGQLQKAFANRWEGMLAYTYQRARDITTTTSSTAGSNYRYQRSVKGDLLSRDRSTSKNDQPHKISATGTYSFPTNTNVSLIYSGASGAPFDWVYASNGGSTGDLNADGQTQNDLVYVPNNVNDASEIQFRSFTGGATAAAQAAAFDKFINSMECLKNARGTIMDRNSCRNPWINQFDLSIAQNLRTFGMGNAQVRLDIVNFGNLLNKKWGATQYSDQGATCGQLCGSTTLMTHVGTALPTGTTSGKTGVPIVQFNPDFKAFSNQFAGSNYRMQLSARYSF